MRSSLRVIAAILMIAGLIGCSNDGRTRPPPTTVRVVNVAPSYGELSFLREEMTEATLPYDAGAQFSFDSDTYEFSVETNAPGAAPVRVQTLSASVNELNEYFVVITESAGSAQMLLIPQAASSAATRTAVTVVHAAELQGQVDVYLEPPGTDPATSTPLGSVSFGSSAFSDTLSAGDFEFIVTDPGIPANVLFRSSALSFSSSISALVVIAEEKGLGTAPFGAIIMDSNTQRLLDSNQPSAVRVINGANDAATRDIYLDANFTTPLVAGVTAGALSAYVPITAGSRTLSVTPAGNPSVEEATNTISVVPGRYYTAIIAGNPTDGITVPIVIEDHRAITGTARLNLFNAANSFTSLDYFLLAPGTTINPLFPSVSLPANGSNAEVSLPPAAYELTIRDPVSATIVAGPIAMTLGDATIQGLLTTDAVGASTVDTLLFDDTPP